MEKLKEVFGKTMCDTCKHQNKCTTGFACRDYYEWCKGYLSEDWQGDGIKTPSQYWYKKIFPKSKVSSKYKKGLFSKLKFWVLAHKKRMIPTDYLWQLIGD